MPRLLKQTIIAAIFLAAAGSLVYFSFIKDDSAALPDPAASVQPLLILSKQILKVGDLDYDFVAEIKNPNLDFGAAEIYYELSFFDYSNGLVASRTGMTYLLPGQTRHEIVSPIRTAQEIGSVELKINNVVWEKLDDFVPQNLFLVKGKSYLPLSAGGGSSKLTATLFNNSSFDFDRVDIFAVLLNQKEEILAVGRTDIRTMLAKTDRFFEIKWMSSPDEAVRAEVYPYTDVFKNENFIKEHGTQEKFQRFY